MKSRLDEQALSKLAGVLARRPEMRKEDMTQPFGSGRPGRAKSKGKPGGGSGDDGEDE